MASISMQSLTTRPRKPMRSFSRPVMIRRDMVAGSSSGSSWGKRMWVVVTAGQPASIMAWKGGSSIRSSSSMDLSMQGRLTWVSMAVSPWPGKCLAEQSTPPSV